MKKVDEESVSQAVLKMEAPIISREQITCSKNRQRPRYMYIYISMYVCMYTYIFDIYIHTYIYIHVFIYLDLKLVRTLSYKVHTRHPHAYDLFAHFYRTSYIYMYIYITFLKVFHERLSIISLRQVLSTGCNNNWRVKIR